MKYKVKYKPRYKTLKQKLSEYTQKCNEWLSKQQNPPDHFYWALPYPPKDKLPKPGESWVWEWDGEKVYYDVVKIVNRRFPKAICRGGYTLPLRDCATHNFKRAGHHTSYTGNVSLAGAGLRFV